MESEISRAAAAAVATSRKEEKRNGLRMFSPPTAEWGI
jgi:hypothetical protein